MNDQKSVITQVRDSIGIITCNRPRQRDALTPGMLPSLRGTLEDWTAADRIHAVVITGSGNEAFSAGFDITVIPTEQDPELQWKLDESDPLANALRTLNLLEKSGRLTVSVRDEINQLVAQAMQSADAWEAKQVFIEKRVPKFIGR